MTDHGELPFETPMSDDVLTELRWCYQHGNAGNRSHRAIWLAIQAIENPSIISALERHLAADEQNILKRALHMSMKPTPASSPVTTKMRDWEHATRPASEKE